MSEKFIKKFISYIVVFFSHEGNIPYRCVSIINKESLVKKLSGDLRFRVLYFMCSYLLHLCVRYF